MSDEVPRGVRTVLWRRGGKVVEDFPLGKLPDYLQEEGSLVWADLCAPGHEELGDLADVLSLDRHAVEDALASTERPKATRHASHTFVTVYATRLEADGDPGPGRVESRLETSRVSAFVLPNGVVTVRHDDRFDTDEVVRRWQDHGYLPENGPGALLHGLLDVVVDGHLDTVRVMDEMIESLEDGLFDETSSPRVLQQRTYRLRKELVGLRRVVLPMRDVVGAVVRHRADLHGLGGELDGWYADLYDHTLRAWEWTESLREMVTTVFETNLALQDARLNTVMKKLTGWAGIIAVPTAVTGWFGMNVAYPGIGRTSGFLASTVVISVLVVSLYVVFKRRNWL
ncbi:magnesium transporter CorA family protein [Streptomyces sp. HB2AG]|uniref:magnesium transporter CorA family protein n=1 Tax=Streptomyces sp. HB2AG TaxID=2983400 RepID=UPI0022AA9936|nr:magnesium transporter CorA family protein [Streptomyces sp. HB2AG]MCZ2527483.1 magnesium transporter CorA family protein [Streptomyces sp. HB2AG]